MAPERITGQSYTITSDVWSLGVTLLEVAQHRFPFPADGTGEVQPRAGLIDLLTYIVRQPIPKLKDEPEQGIRWSDNFKFFVDCWYGSPLFQRCVRAFFEEEQMLTFFSFLIVSSLEKEQQRRATPWRMLEHPWMVEMANKKVNMQMFLATVWDWKD
jgi:mitogen-activated protein kinase kinase